MAQTDWKQFDKLIKEGSYKSAYELSEKRMQNSSSSSERLAAAFHMAQAAHYYQEDAYDTAEARYRGLLPQLEGVEKALCYAFLGDYDSALAQPEVLKTTPVKDIEMYCEGEEELNYTPTAFDLLVREARRHGYGTPQQRVQWQQQVVDFHRADDPDFLLWCELQLMEVRNEVPNHHLTSTEWRQLLDRYRSSESQYVATIYFMLASVYNDEERFVEAVACCDSAISRWPKSEGGSQCFNLRSIVTQKEVNVNEDGLTVYPKFESLQQLAYRNVNHVWLRIIPYFECDETSVENRKKLLSVRPLKRWDEALPANSEHRRERANFAMPALKTGRYWLLVSTNEDFEADGFNAYEVNCTDMRLVRDGAEGFLIDSRTGRPIVGQEVRLEEEVHGGPNEVLLSVITDQDGHYSFPEQKQLWRLRVVIERGGYTLYTYYMQHYTDNDKSYKTRAELRSDRPIYRPGETVQGAVLLYRTDGFNAEVAASAQLKASFRDPNNQQIDTLLLHTNDMGIAEFSFAIPTDRLPGQYSVEITQGWSLYERLSVRVEEYKQPKFMVSLSRDEGEAPVFGRELKVSGLAASYSEVPISGARVQYRVVRRQLRRFWWQWWGFEKEDEVATGELTTASDGSFAIPFTPEPDSTVELGHKPVFEYMVNVDVTDINGESHSAATTVRVGFRNAILALEHGSTMQNLRIRHTDLDGNALNGKVDMRVELLQQPSVPLLAPAIVDKEVHQLLSEREYAKHFPLLAYSKDYNDPATWQGKEVVDYSRSGVYRITLTAADADTAVEYITYTAPDEHRPQSQQLLWSEVDKGKAEVGENVKLRFGSRFEGVEVYYRLMVDAEVRDFRRVRINNELHTISLGVDSSMLGGFDIQLWTVREGFTQMATHHIAVPYTHKQLKVEISTFRDKLLPGQQEQWIINVSGQQGGEESAMVLTMYDDALNSYGSTQSWDFSPWHLGSSPSPSWHVISGGWKYLMRHTGGEFYRGARPSVWSLKEALPRYYHYYMTKSMSRNVAVHADEVGAVEEAAMMESEDAVSSSASIDMLQEVEEDTFEKSADKGAGNTVASEPQVRSNLNTLAFFAPCIRTATDGTATYTFTVPELLTRWNVRGLAITKDIKIGTLDKSLVTRKPLMVQPNVPRFLRSGDSLSMMAKVVNLDDADHEVEVSFLLTDAATGNILCQHVEHIRVVAGSTEGVQFPVEVPQDVYVATYEIIARAEGLSDGERGQIPVVSNRCAVTISQAMYINGVGEKHYRLPQWLDPSDTRQPRLLSAEVVSNPIWLAIKTMPYLSDYENPSSLYLANRLYINTLGQRIIGSIAGLENFEQIGHTSESRLQMNEEVKQTLLQATPWVRAAQSEVEQMQQVVNYFDKEKLQQEHIQTLAQLRDRQNADGGWGWMPEGESSLWVTEQVLLHLKENEPDLQSSIAQALKYLDSKEQYYYDYWIKPNLLKGYNWQPTNIHYLYTRSLYGKATTEAYKFYYSNVLKHYKEYDNLYTQAQLALIFYRHGDRKQALDLLRRLKEKSLTSDEMGLYWRDNTSGWFWYQRPIETQALLIQAFNEITPNDTETIGLMQQWLLKQKQTQHWGSDAATTEAIRALCLGPAPMPNTQPDPAAISLTVCGVPLQSPVQGLEGYQSQMWSGEALSEVRNNRSDEVLLRKSTDGIAWGAVYYQFEDDLDRVPASDMGIKIKRTYLCGDTLHVGDHIKVRIDIQVDRAMDYLELIDGRPSCTEPLSTRAGWRWNDGLRYYIMQNNTDTRCYAEHLDRGSYYFEYDLYITNPGTFLAGAVTMQCMYAPEFRAIAPAQRLTVLP